MKMRLSNGQTFAVAFSANDAAAFRLAIRRAAFEFFAHESYAGRSRGAELQVATDSGEWMSANYPSSNLPYRVRFGAVDAAEFSAVQRSNHRGTWFEYEMAAFASTVASDA